VSEVAQKAKKAYGVRARIRDPSTAAQNAAEGRRGRGVYSVGALSLVVKEAAEEDVFVVLTG
jgi:hypothetical protein